MVPSHLIPVLEAKWGLAADHDLQAELDRDEWICLMLVEVFGWTYSEVADWLGIDHDVVAEHVARSLRSLRTAVVMGPLIASILDRSASAPARS